MSILTVWVHDRFAGNTNSDSCSVSERDSTNYTNDTVKPTTSIFSKWGSLMLGKYFK